MTPHFNNLQLVRSIISITLIISSLTANSQNCEPNFKLVPVTRTNAIEWSKFPEFTLPFKIIYSGPRLGDDQAQPLKHGFSQLSILSDAEHGSLTNNQMANLWYGVADNSGVYQPWGDNVLRSPWGNDSTAYRNYWNRYVESMGNPAIVCLDIERMHREDRDILQLKSNPAIPQQYRNMSDQDFLSTYKRDIRWWYTEAAKAVKAKNPNTLVTGYSDSPIRNTWLNITTYSWQDWTTNLARTHYLTQNNQGGLGGSYFDIQDVMAPSIYYYYDYDSPIGEDYLPYLLFHIEVNAAVGKKPVIPFVWLRIHDSYNNGTPMVQPFVAEATAIFPFFSGAKGLWLWDNPFLPGSRVENFAPYEHFIHGLYRLSEHRAMFEGNYELVIPQPARDQMEQQNPIWRGVVKDGNILIAAQNPYAANDQITNITVYYKNWLRVISLKGKEVFLCKFNLNDTVTATLPALVQAYIYPNPTANSLNIVLKGENSPRTVDFLFMNVAGQRVLSQKLAVAPGETTTHVALPKLPAGLYIARFTEGEHTITRHVVISP